ncbi:prostatic steroid-binding protein C1-like [Phodopus roborovskii]|uniref:prostatic steroid-binding protein C1-like n=1 Tax=Phodopus roborovskii TaxID=109678 RepID=UPI0021E4826E|nr:prostatic steroid-binding protein C1-like [Phodopus roborovskii]
MRLSLCVLLVILAVHCYEANAATVCKPVLRESTLFLTMPEEVVRKELEKYNAPPEAVEAKLEVKRCVDNNLGTLDKKGILEVLRSILDATPLWHPKKDKGGPTNDSVSPKHTVGPS